MLVMQIQNKFSLKLSIICLSLYVAHYLVTSQTYAQDSIQGGREDDVIRAPLPNISAPNISEPDISAVPPLNIEDENETNITDPLLRETIDHTQGLLTPRPLSDLPDSSIEPLREEQEFTLPKGFLQNYQDAPSQILNTQNITNITGVLGALDKVTARVSTMKAPINDIILLGNLEIVMRYCQSAPPEEQPETRAFIEITEYIDETAQVIFSGWMFASSPAINALEHPVYDVWVKDCTTSDGFRFTGKR